MLRARRASKLVYCEVRIQGSNPVRGRVKAVFKYADEKVQGEYARVVKVIRRSGVRARIQYLYEGQSGHIIV